MVPRTRSPISYNYETHLKTARLKMEKHLNVADLISSRNAILDSDSYRLVEVSSVNCNHSTIADTVGTQNIRPEEMITLMIIYF